MPAELSDDLKLYLSEMSELIELLEDGLLRLEKSQDAEVVAEAFRAAHTLKGSSATAGLTEIAQVTHAMEDLMDTWREGAPVLPDQVSLLFEGLDWLNEAKRRLEDGKDRPEVGDLVSRLRRSAGRSEAAAASGNGAAAASARLPAAGEPDGGQVWPEAIRSEIEEAVAKGYAAYCMRVDLDQATVMPSVRAFQVRSAMEEMGRVPWSDPSIEQIERDEVGLSLNLVVITDREQDELSRITSGIADVAGVSLSPVRIQAQKGAPRQRAAGRVLGSSVRLDVEVLDSLMNLIGELVVDRTRLVQLTSGVQDVADLEEFGKNLGGISARIARISTQLQEGIMRARLVPIQNLVRKYPRMIRDLASESGKDVNLIIEGEQTELDRSVIEAIDDPLIHILRNAVDHGVERPEERLKAGKPATGTVSLTASHHENQVVIVIEDDGKGIDADHLRASAVRKGILTEDSAKRLTEDQALELIFLPGFSTKERISEVSGRGVGMDVVRTNLKKINGSIEIKTRPGRGTRFTMRLPLTLAIIQALLVRSGGTEYAVPLSMVSEAVKIEPGSVSSVRGKPVIRVRNRVFPLVDLDSLFFPSARTGDREYAVITTSTGTEAAIAVDSLLGQQEIVVKNLGKFFGTVRGISGATILGDGDLALIVDVTRLVMGREADEKVELFDEAAAS